MLRDSKMLISDKMAIKVNHLRSIGELVPLKNVDTHMLNKFSNFLVQNELYDVIHREELDENLTYFGVRDGEIYSCILFNREEDDQFRNTFLFENDKKASPDTLIYLLAISAYEAFTSLKPDTGLIFWIDEAVTKKLITQLLPKATVIYTAARYTLNFEDIQKARAQRFESDGMELVENKNLSCADCIHCTQDVTKCKIYSQKPSKVLDGKECPDHKAAD